MADTFPARQAEPGQVFSWTDPTGVAHELVADATGIVRPGSPEAARIADAFSLPIAETRAADVPPAPDAQRRSRVATTETVPVDPAKED